MEFAVFAVLVVIVAAVVLVVNSRVRRGTDRPDDRGPYSSAMSTRGDFAVMGTTLDEQPKPDAAEDDPKPDAAGDDPKG